MLRTIVFTLGIVNLAIRLENCVQFQVIFHILSFCYKIRWVPYSIQAYVEPKNITVRWGFHNNFQSWPPYQKMSIFINLISCYWSPPVELYCQMCYILGGPNGGLFNMISQHESWSCCRIVTRSCAGTSFPSRRRKDSTLARRSTNPHGTTRLTTTDWTGTPLGRLPPPPPTLVLLHILFVKLLRYRFELRKVINCQLAGLFQRWNSKVFIRRCISKTYLYGDVWRVFRPAPGLCARVRCVRATSHPPQVVRVRLGLPNISLWRKTRLPRLGIPLLRWEARLNDVFSGRIPLTLPDRQHCWRVFVKSQFSTHSHLNTPVDVLSLCVSISPVFAVTSSTAVAVTLDSAICMYVLTIEWCE